MKKLLFVTFGIGLSLFFTACGGGDKKDDVLGKTQQELKDMAAKFAQSEAEKQNIAAGLADFQAQLAAVNQKCAAIGQAASAAALSSVQQLQAGGSNANSFASIAALVTQNNSGQGQCNDALVNSVAQFNTLGNGAIANTVEGQKILAASLQSALASLMTGQFTAEQKQAFLASPAYSAIVAQAQALSPTLATSLQNQTAAWVAAGSTVATATATPTATATAVSTVQIPTFNLTTTSGTAVPTVAVTSTVPVTTLGLTSTAQGMVPAEQLVNLNQPRAISSVQQ